MKYKEYNQKELPGYFNPLILQKMVWKCICYSINGNTDTDSVFIQNLLLKHKFVKLVSIADIPLI